MAVALDWLLRTSWQSAVLIGIVVAIQLALGKRLAPRWRHALWMIVVVRLLMPAVPASSWSVFNLRWSATTRAQESAPALAAEQVVVVRYGMLPAADAGSEVLRRPGLVATSHPGLRSTSDTGVAVSTVLAIVWLIGAGFCAARVTVSVLSLHRRVRATAAPADLHTLALLTECQRELNIRTAPRVLLTDAVSSPALLGVFRPKLLLPPRLVEQLSRAELRFVLLHELAHLKRHDALTNAAVMVAEVVHWFNPLARLALSRSRAEREMACDELAMSSAAEAGDYGRAVLRVAEAFSARRAPWAAVGMIHTRSQLRRRIAMIATFSPRGRSRKPVFPALLVLCLASCALTDGKDNAAPAENAPQKPVAAAPERVASSGKGVDRSLQEQLDKRLDMVTFESTALEEVVEYFREQIGEGGNIYVDWKLLEAAGIDRGAPVSIRLRNVPLSKALQIVLDHVGGDAVKLGSVADGNILRITTADAIAQDVTVAVYDIRDLIIDIQDFTDAPELGEPKPILPAKAVARPDPEVAKAEAAAKRAGMVESIVTLVQDTVDPMSWANNGGTVGSIRELQGQLVVTQTAENHRQISNLLAQLRETRAVQVVVEARFLTVNLDKLPDAVQKKLTVGLQEKADARPAFLSDEEVKTTIGSGQTTTAPRITLFNGQRAYVMTATEHAYVSGYKAVKPEGGGETRWEKEMSSISAGVVLDVAATMSADQKSVVLKLRPKLSRLEKMANLPFEGPPGAPRDLTVEVPQVSTQSLQTTVNIPNGQTIVLGGLTPAAGKGESHYILVKPTLIIERESRGGSAAATQY